MSTQRAPHSYSHTLQASVVTNEHQVSDLEGGAGARWGARGLFGCFCDATGRFIRVRLGVGSVEMHDVPSFISRLLISLQHSGAGGGYLSVHDASPSRHNGSCNKSPLGCYKHVWVHVFVTYWGPLLADFILSQDKLLPWCSSPPFCSDVNHVVIHRMFVF